GGPTREPGGTVIGHVAPNMSKVKLPEGEITRKSEAGERYLEKPPKFDKEETLKPKNWVGPGQKAQGVGQRRQADGDEPSGVPPIVEEVLNSPGKPLDAATRQLMESRFGHDFSHVRVHTDAKAAASARAVNAQAYTVGRDIVFGQGRYQPTHD